MGFRAGFRCLRIFCCCCVGGGGGGGLLGFRVRGRGVVWVWGGGLESSLRLVGFRCV